jgi:hypothetical protein
MANLKLTHIWLRDGFPGEANQNLGIPTDGWDNTVDNFNTADDTAKSTSPPIPIGQKRTVYTDNSNAPGTYTCMYLAYHDYSSVDISGDFSNGPPFCAHVESTHATNLGTDLTQNPYFVVSRCYTAAAWDGTKGLPVALPCSTNIAGDSSIELTPNDPAAAGYGHGWGWFWVGGVCPAKDVTLFKGTADSLAGADTTATLTEPGPMTIAIDTARAVIAIADTTASIEHGFGDNSAE